jgi:hypothetical protein
MVLSDLVSYCYKLCILKALLSVNQEVLIYFEPLCK